MQSNQNKEIGTRIRVLRESKFPKLKVTEAARRAGISQPFWTQIEKGDRGVTSKQAENIANVLETTAPYILYGETTKKPPAPGEGVAENEMAPHLREALIWLKETDPNKIAALKKLHLLSKELPPEALDQLASALSELLSPLPDPDAVGNKRSR